MAESAAYRPSKRLGPPHLRVVEVDFLKPTLRNEETPTVESDEKRQAAVLTSPEGWD
jgi:hypothetical protein